MSGRKSRTKGRTAEREVELILQAAGLQTERAIGGREQVSGDIAARVDPTVYANFCPECKAPDTMGRTYRYYGRQPDEGPCQNIWHLEPASPELAIEVRRRERLDVAGWSRDHEASTPPHQLPAVVYRRSREPWRISMTLSDFLSLIGGSVKDDAG